MATTSCCAGQAPSDWHRTALAPPFRPPWPPSPLSRPDLLGAAVVVFVHMHHKADTGSVYAQHIDRRGGNPGPRAAGVGAIQAAYYPTGRMAGTRVRSLTPRGPPHAAPRRPMAVRPDRRAPPCRPSRVGPTCVWAAWPTSACWWPSRLGSLLGRPRADMARVSARSAHCSESRPALPCWGPRPRSRGSPVPFTRENRNMRVPGPGRASRGSRSTQRPASPAPRLRTAAL